MANSGVRRQLHECAAGVIQTNMLAKNKQFSQFQGFYLYESNCIQLTRWKRLKCRTYSSEMLQCEADLKTRTYIGGDIPKPLVLQ